jgi:hypothetical protein
MAGRRLKVAVKNSVGLQGVKQVRVLAGPARGVRMTLDFAGRTPMYLGMFEWELHRFLRQTVPGAKLVFDVGGHIGYYALLLAANTTGRIVTFEPDPEQIDLLEANLGLNPELRDRITVSPVALGIEHGKGQMTLDRACEEFGAPDLIKMDIDGGEYDALSSGVKMLRENHPHVVVETHSKQLEDDCGSLLRDCGYSPIIKHNRRVWREERGGAELNRWLVAAGSPGPRP